jgi:type II secretory pathway predicted ATPase ExeA
VQERAIGLLTGEVGAGKSVAVRAALPAMPRSEWTFDTTTTSWQKVVNDLATAFLDRQS